MTGRNNYLPLE